MTTLRALVGAYSLSGGFIARGQQQVWTRHCPCCGRWLAKQDPTAPWVCSCGWVNG
jgi:hypothetical protein